MKLKLSKTQKNGDNSDPQLSLLKEGGRTPEVKTAATLKLEARLKHEARVKATKGMKTTFKKEKIPKPDPNLGPKVAHRFAKKDFVQMMSDAVKYPLSIRIAAELFRGHVDGKRFLNEFHMEGNSFSASILEEITKFDLHKGFNPEGVPPVLPVFARYTTKAEKLSVKPGRPTTEEAQDFLRKILNDCLKRGWDEVDFINNLRDLVDSESNTIKTIRIEGDLPEEKKTKVKLEKAYFTRIASKWQRFPTIMEAEKAMMDDDKKVLGPVEAVDSNTHCAYCKFRLNGIVVSIRSNDQKTIDHMHMGCYWMEVAHTSQIPIGMVVLSAPDGIYYEYRGAQGGGWKKKEPTLATPVPTLTTTTTTPAENKKNETINSGTKSSSGIPAPEGKEHQPSATLPASKAA